MLLVVCPRCSRHTRNTEARCPFCGQRRAPTVALLGVAAACLCGASCTPTTPDPAPLASSTVTPAPSTPAASASAELGRFELGRAAVYGAPPPSASAAPRPRGTVSIELVTPPDRGPANTERVVRGMLPGFRLCYNRALQTAPEQAAKLEGKLRLVLHVAAAGHVESAVVTPQAPELASAVACIRARALAALFEESDHASVLTTELRLALAPWAGPPPL